MQAIVCTDGRVGKRAMVGTLVDTRPILQADNSGIWDKIEHVKRGYYDAIVANCLERDVLADVYMSGPGVYPAWVLVEMWLARGSPKELRASLKIEIHSHPHMVHPVTVTVTIRRGGREKVLTDRTAFPEKRIRELVFYLLDGGTCPSLYSYRIGGLWHFQPRQRPVGITTDYYRIFVWPMAVLGFFFLATGANDPSPDEQATLVPLGVALILGAFFCSRLLARREVRVVSNGRPAEDPRLLSIIDNWGALIRGASDAEQTLKTCIKSVVESAPEMGLKSRFETIEYYSPSGKQSREQLVIARNKVIIFFHCYQFGPDLYVGWDSYLNIVAWSDKPTMTGAARPFGRRVEVRDVVKIYDSPTEYDLIEHNSLSAWFHERLRKEIEALAAQRSLTLTLDFDVTKSDRSMALSTAQRQAQPTKTRTGVFNLASLVRKE
jgi:hypothetical protein